MDSDERTVEVRHARQQDGQLFWERHIYRAGEEAVSEVLPDWSVPVDEIFAGV